MSATCPAPDCDSTVAQAPDHATYYLCGNSHKSLLNAADLLVLVGTRVTEAWRSDGEDTVCAEQVAALCEQIASLQAENAALRQQISATGQVLRSRHLTAAQKLVALAAANEVRSAVTRTGQEAPALYLGVLAEQTGLSEDAAGRALAVLSGPAAPFTKLTAYEQGETLDADTGEAVPRPRRVTRVMPRQDTLVGTLLALAEYQPPARAGWGGKRERRCPDHPGAGTKVLRAVVCAAEGCGRVLAGEVAGLSPQLAVIEIHPERPSGSTYSPHLAAIGPSRSMDPPAGPRLLSRRCRLCREDLLAHERGQGTCTRCTQARGRSACTSSPSRHQRWLTFEESIDAGCSWCAVPPLPTGDISPAGAGLALT